MNNLPTIKLAAFATMLDPARFIGKKVFVGSAPVVYRRKRSVKLSVSETRPQRPKSHFEGLSVEERQWRKAKRRTKTQRIRPSKPMYFAEFNEKTKLIKWKR